MFSLTSCEVRATMSVVSIGDQLMHVGNVERINLRYWGSRTHGMKNKTPHHIY